MSSYITTYTGGILSQSVESLHPSSVFHGYQCVYITFVSFIPKNKRVDTMCAVGASMGANGCIIRFCDAPMQFSNAPMSENGCKWVHGRIFMGA